MPLIHSSSPAALHANMRTLSGEIGKSPHVQSRDQAIAIALDIKRRSKHAFGGAPAPWFVRNEARGMMRGPILSAVAGRTDHHPMSVASGSYVLPADHMSHLGQGNSLSGANVVNRMFRMGPYGGAAPSIKHGMGAPKPPKMQGVMGASGGAMDAGGARGSHGAPGAPVPIMAAGGEFVVPPEKLLEFLHRSGLPANLKYGHAMMDEWVKSTRQKHIKTLKKLPGPAKS